MLVLLTAVVRSTDVAVLGGWLSDDRLLARCLRPYERSRNISEYLCVLPKGSKLKCPEHWIVVEADACVLSLPSADLYVWAYNQHKAMSTKAVDVLVTARPVLPFLVEGVIEEVVRLAVRKDATAATVCTIKVPAFKAATPGELEPGRMEVHGCRAFGKTALAALLHTPQAAQCVGPAQQLVDAGLLGALSVLDPEQLRLIQAYDQC